MAKPSSRDYKHEAAIESPKKKRDRILQKRARRRFIAAHGKAAAAGKDVSHKDNNAGNNSLSNLTAQSPSKNRSFARAKGKGSKAHRA